MSNSYSEPTVPIGLNAFGEWISEVVKLWSAQWSVWVVQGFICFLIIQLPSLIIKFSHSGSPVINLGVVILSVISSSILLPGMVYTALRQIRGEPISSTDLFCAVRFGWGMFVFTVAAVLGLVACCIGTFVTFGLFFLAIPLMIDRKIPTIAALQLSWRTASKNFWLYVLFSLMMSVIACTGMICWYIGTCVTIPFLYIGIAVAYYHTFVQNTSITPPFISGTMPPPYLPTEQPDQLANDQPVPPVPPTKQGACITVPFLYIGITVAYYHTFVQNTSITPPFISGTMPPPYLPAEALAQTEQPAEPSVEASNEARDKQNLPALQL